MRVSGKARLIPEAEAEDRRKDADRLENKLLEFCIERRMELHSLGF